MSEYDNYDDYSDLYQKDEYEALYGTNKITPWKVIKKTFKILVKIFAVLFMAALLYRIFLTGDTAFSKKFLWTESSISAYNKSPEEFKSYYYKRPNNMTEDGKFSASNIYFTPSISQFQITIRYNDSTLRKLADEYKLEKIPDGEVFVFTLSDNLGNIYTEYKYTEDTKSLYNYRRVVFDGIDMNSIKTTEEEDGKTKEEKFSELYINIYFTEDVVLSKPYGKITVYDNNFYHEPIDLSKHISKNNTPSVLKNKIQYKAKEEPSET